MFYLQTHEQTPVVLDLTNDLADADTILQFASPSAPVISPMRESPVPEPPMPVPSAWHTKVSKKRLRFLEKEAKRMKKVKIALQKKIRFASPIPRRILGSAVARSGVSFYDAELLCAASVRAFLHDAGITHPGLNEKVALSCTPSRATFNEYIDETAAEKIWLFLGIL